MDRRSFLKTSAIATTAMVTMADVTTSCSPKKQTAEDTDTIDVSQWRGFNNTNTFPRDWETASVDEWNFEFMAENGFNFMRLPLNYWNWVEVEREGRAIKHIDWYKLNDKALDYLDRIVATGKQYGIHINICMHRIPGYCVNGADLEPYQLYDEDPAKYNVALDAAAFHWRMFAGRYKGIPNKEVSFDLFNEPPFFGTEERYDLIARRLVKEIRDVSPNRVIVADGLQIGQLPVQSIVDLNLIQSTRGYQPKMVSHYKATYVPANEFESLAEPTWPMHDDAGNLWDRALLRQKSIEPWKVITDKGVKVHVGEWGVMNQTPQDVALAFMEDYLALWKEVGWGWAIWGINGSFGIVDNPRPGVELEDYKGRKVNRAMLELLKRY
ncbi:MAG: cellulase family glycosylhydrolase [Tannerellaceae bacterium]|jgi:endoglucanase|nr:cellulase family glycosylhydrolase [Tannerellaceae bacterium]